MSSRSKIQHQCVSFSVKKNKKRTKYKFNSTQLIQPSKIEIAVLK